MIPGSELLANDEKSGRCYSF